MSEDTNSNTQEGALRVTKGTASVSSINPKPAVVGRRKVLTTDQYVAGILARDRVILSQAITLVESTLPAHQEQAQAVLERCLPHAGDTIRVGITGVPGVGKSTLIEQLGLFLTTNSHRLAVLTVDPSSVQTKGSILGDKTRMPRLSANPNAFIRPSPTAGTLGGVARATRETIILCEAAGYDVIFVETVGVGQSETTVHKLVDFFLLLMLAGAGDELQGIKRGIVEMADAIAITKAEGDHLEMARVARNHYRNALHFFPAKPSGWNPRVLTCSALTGDGIDTLWETIEAYREHTRGNGYFDLHRQQQAHGWMMQSIKDQLAERFFGDPAIQGSLPQIEKQVIDGTLSPFAATQRLLSLYFRKEEGFD